MIYEIIPVQNVSFEVAVGRLFLLVLLLSLFPNGGYEMQTKWEVKHIIQVCKMLHLFISTFRHGALISSYISKWWLRAANEMGSQLWCYISLSRYIIQVCKMLHLSGSTFRHGALFSSYICKWWLLHVQSEYLEHLSLVS